MTDMKLLRPAIRLHAACQINRITTPQTKLDECVSRLESIWGQLHRQIRNIRHALCRNWPGAAKSQIDSSHYERIDLSQGLNELSQILSEISNSPKLALCSLRDIWQDLHMLDEEFPRVHWNRNEIIVTTPDINLEDVYLGPFEIHLPYSSLGRPPGQAPFDVVAVDPQPSSKRSEVTHPHVESNGLCTGDATDPINRALAEGRIADFFQIVSSVLETYNEDSPYVRLEEWFESSDYECEECGYRMAEDDAGSCQRCRRYVCGECSYGCNQCSHTVCANCSTYCQTCDYRSCTQGCMRVCAACETRVCRGCANQEGLCESCQEEPAQKGNTHESTTSNNEITVGVCAANQDPENQVVAIG